MIVLKRTHLVPIWGVVLILLCSWIGETSASSLEDETNKQKQDVIKWTKLPQLPCPEGVGGAFIGVHNDVLIVAGGASFPQAGSGLAAKKLWHDEIYVLERTDADQYKWYTGFKLDYPLAYGASVTTTEGLVCIGGRDSEKCYADVFILKWDKDSKTIIKETLPSLPKPCAFGAAAKVDVVVYLAGGCDWYDL